MISDKVVIKNPTGLHLRPAGLFCKNCNAVQEQDHSVQENEK